ncbi:unnamed protein product [Macrosiphum euphorbiae]|uniref:Uncharacterized protein n=1 Tax=Macrosiphum euphorbiae TaxID=13131 RepID=A0AAV0WNT5_9HEMI|nr:unnamed protein product [Macrosiphum euphorbiae]
MSMFGTISERVENDQRTSTVKHKHILKLIIENSSIHPLARSVFESAYRGFDLSRQDVQLFRELHGRRDDFFANFYPELSRIVIESPEAFRLVGDVIRSRRPIDRLNAAETEERSHTCMIASNYLPVLPAGIDMVRFTIQDARLAENNLGLLSALYGHPGKVATL